MVIDTISEREIRITHERMTWPMRVWSSDASPGRWFWNLDGGRVLGEDKNVLDATTRAMVALEKMAQGFESTPTV